MKRLDESIICTGFGGQGILLMGKLIAQTAMMENYKTTWMPSYGAEVRGGTAHSMVRISTEEIASPLVRNPDTCISMNKPSFEKFVNRVKPGGVIIANTSMITDLPKGKTVKIIGLALTELASDIGNIKAANMIALGAYTKIKKFLPLESVIRCLKEILKGKTDMLAINERALRKGASLV